MTAESPSAYMLSFVVGVAVGLSELLSRHRWSTKLIGRTAAGWVYLGFNGAVAVLAYLAAVDWELVVLPEDRPAYWRVIFVGVAAMCLLRSSIAQVKIDGQDVSIGLTSILEVFAKRAERRLDQTVANRRWSSVDIACRELSYQATRSFWQAIVESALSTYSQTERAGFRSALDSIDDMPVDDDLKMRLLAMTVWEILGEEFFETTARDAGTKFRRGIEAERAMRGAKADELVALRESLEKSGVGGSHVIA